MKVEIVVNNVWSRIRNLEDIEIIDSLDKKTSFYIEGYQYTKAFRSGWYDKKSGKFKHWDGKKHLLTNRLVFPTGLLKRIEAFFKFYKIDYSIKDNRKEFKLVSIPISEYTPRYYQQEALDAVIKANGNASIRLPTGSGKTFLAGMITATYNLPTIVYVIGKDLLYQFHEEMEKVLNCKVGMIGDGKCEIEKFTICSVWTAAKAFGINKAIFSDDEDWAPEIFNLDSKQKQYIKNTIESANVAIFDEAHYLATDTLQSIYKASKNCRYKIALSGSLWRDDGADLLLESVCGPIAYKISASKLIDEGFLVKPKISFISVPPLDEEPKNYQSVYRQYISEGTIRNNLIVDAAKILIKKGRKLLILVRYLSHGEKLAEMLSEFPLFFVNGEVDGETRIEVKKAFENGEYKCLIASSVFDIGIDIKCLDGLILCSGGKSTIRAIQRIGRVIRTSPNKNDAIVVDFLDNAKYLYKHSLIRMAVYNTEPNFQLKLPKNFDKENIKKIKKEVSKIK